MAGRLAIDANLLVLLIVGSESRESIRRHKRLSAYTAGDFDQLVGIVARFDALLLLPHTLTETSNLIRLCAKPWDKHLTIRLAAFIDAWPEWFQSSRIVSLRPEFPDLGLTDAALIDLLAHERGGGDVSLLTVDLDLWAAARKAGFAAVNFNHIRIL